MAAARALVSTVYEARSVVMGDGSVHAAVIMADTGVGALSRDGGGSRGESTLAIKGAGLNPAPVPVKYLPVRVFPNGSPDHAIGTTHRDMT